MNLSPKVPSRCRSNSTNVRQGLPAASIGRRGSACVLQLLNTTNLEPAAEPNPLATTQPAKESVGMLAVIVQRCYELLHLNPRHSLMWSAPSSPRSSEDDLMLLPMSATAPTFDGKIPPTSQSTWGIPTVHAPILFVILLFPLSTLCVLYCLTTLPITLEWPHNITDLATLGRELHGYSQSGHAEMAHVVAVMSISAVWKHAWSIPGSVMWNVLAGALFPSAFATLLLTTLTMIGSVCATMLSTPLAPVLSTVFPRALDMTRSALEGGEGSKNTISTDMGAPKTRASAWVRLTVLRLIGVVPWSGINIACGVCGVPILDCALGAFIGTLPWTAVTCQIGDILQTVASTPSPSPQSVSSLLTSPEIIIKLVFLSFLSLAPILGKDQLRALITPAPQESVEGEERRSRFVWVKEWRSKLASRSSTRERSESYRTLEILITEKNEMQPLST